LRATAPARRRYTTRIERLSNLPERRRACLLCLSDDGKDVGCVPISFGLDRAALLAEWAGTFAGRAYLFQCRMPDAQQLANISAPRGKSAAQCERQLFQAVINMIVAENSYHEKSLEADNHAGSRSSDDPVGRQRAATRSG
jgi:hypothetical protein